MSVKKNKSGSGRKKLNFTFSCTCCGNCCSEEGVVNFSGKEVSRAAEYLGMTRGEFINRYLEKSGRSYVHVVDKGKSCRFLEKRKCIINEVKPEQCATFPFWKEYVDRDGKLVNFDRHCAGIRIMAPSDGTAGESS
ncbi:MAG TPA: YkgJ family cysteine cluster protein [Spirochaetota bacterium]|nr:YkgJ family cysteine cluster protein [Spirochaetota bacterium]